MRALVWSPEWGGRSNWTLTGTVSNENIMVIEPGLVNESEPEVRREERTRRLGLFVGIDSPNKYLIFTRLVLTLTLSLSFSKLN